MSNMFDQYAEAREGQQQKMEEKLQQQKGPSKRVALTLSIDPDYHTRFKIMAAEAGLPMSKLLQKWIDENSK